MPFLNSTQLEELHGISSANYAAETIDNPERIAQHVSDQIGKLTKQIETLQKELERWQRLANAGS
jgi:hypothetical protein